MNQKNILKNIIAKQGTATEFDPITDAEIDEMFGTAAGTGTDAQDYVIEYVNNQNDGYTKWASGKLECWKRVSTSVDITSSWGSLYYGSVSSISYPVAFMYNPTVNITAQVANGGGWLVPNYDNYSASGTGTLYFYRPTSQSNTAVTINISCIGRWK